MLGRREDLLHRAGLHDPSQVHHGHAVGDVPRQSEVVGHHEAGQIELVAEPQQQRQDLAADRRVQRRHRLVGHQDLRIERHGSGDHDPLPLSSGQLVGVAQEQPLGGPQAGPGECIGHRGLLVHDAAVDPDPFGDRVVHRVPGVERPSGILLDQLDLASVGLQRTARVARVGGRRTTPCPTWDAPARARSGPGSSCRNPTRRPGPRSRAGGPRGRRRRPPGPPRARRGPGTRRARRPRAAPRRSSDRLLIRRPRAVRARQARTLVRQHQDAGRP